MAGLRHCGQLGNILEKARVYQSLYPLNHLIAINSSPDFHNNSGYCKSTGSCICVAHPLSGSTGWIRLRSIVGD